MANGFALPEHRKKAPQSLPVQVSFLKYPSAQALSPFVRHFSGGPV
jgi:hypothetical protein